MRRIFDRRRFLQAGGTLLGAHLFPLCLPNSAYAAQLLSQSSVALIDTPLNQNPFTLGVASGWPQPHSVVLWTRLAPEPLTPQGGMPPLAVPVKWEVAADSAFKKIVATGDALAMPDFGHSVNVEVAALQSGRDYWYRFHAAGATSTVGRTRTAPAWHDVVTNARLAFASCQNYEHGYFAAHRDMAQQNLDAVVFLGDYIYEGRGHDGMVRKHVGQTCKTLDDYRQRYAQYRLDPDLQACHASAPWMVIWDDHEVSNDYAGRSEAALDPQFVQRRLAAYQAWCEFMPVSLPHVLGLTQGKIDAVLTHPQPTSFGALSIHTQFNWGQLFNLYALDGRQYRDPQPCAPNGKGGSSTVVAGACQQLSDPSRSFLGAQQEAWLKQHMGQRSVGWNILAQTTLLAPLHMGDGDAARIWTDGWDGYPAARQRFLHDIAHSHMRNPVVLSGDVHANWVSDLKVGANVADFANPKRPVIGTEFCGTSVSSHSSWKQEKAERVAAQSPHIRYVRTDQRGYGLIDLSPQRMQVSLRYIKEIVQSDSEIGTLAQFLVEDGKPGARREA